MSWRLAVVALTVSAISCFAGPKAETSSEPLDFRTRTLAAESPEHEILKKIIRKAASHPPLGEGHVATVYPFPCDDRFVLKVPKTVAQVTTRLKSSSIPKDKRRQKAKQMLEHQLESYKIAARRAGGVVAPIAVYEFSQADSIPYVIVQQRADPIVYDRLKKLLDQGQKGRAKKLLQDNIDLRIQAIEQGFWEIVDNFTVNNGFIDGDGRETQVIIDAGELQTERPKPERLVRTQQTSLVEHLDEWSPSLGKWYRKQLDKRLGSLAGDKLDKLWNSEGPKPIDYPEAKKALEKIADAGQICP